MSIDVCIPGDDTPDLNLNLSEAGFHFLFTYVLGLGKQEAVGLTEPQLIKEAISRVNQAMADGQVREFTAEKVETKGAVQSERDEWWVRDRLGRLERIVDKALGVGQKVHHA